LPWRVDEEITESPLPLDPTERITAEPAEALGAEVTTESADV